MKQKKITEKQLRGIIREMVQTTLKEQEPGEDTSEQFTDAILTGIKLYQQLDELTSKLYRQGVANKNVRNAALKIKRLKDKCYQIKEGLKEIEEELKGK